MKKIGYIVYGILFHIFRVFGVNKKKVVLFMVHNCHFKGNLNFIYEEMRQRDPNLKFVITSKKEIFALKGAGVAKVFSLIRAVWRFYVVLNFHLATAKYVFLNDNFQPMAYMNFSKETRIVQLWHGVGAFKRFGLSTETIPLNRMCTEKGNQRLTHLIVSCPQVIGHYAEAFGVDPSVIYPDGVPVTDYYFDEERKARGLERFYEKYPELKEKKILLYTPTFRKTLKENLELLNHFDYKEVKKQLGEEWAILIRLHPQVHETLTIDPDYAYDMTEYDDVKDLYLVSNTLVNDYSSTVVEFALFGKPIVLYPYDFEEYDRGFYCDYKLYAPGPITYTLEDMIARVKEEKADTEAIQRFIEVHYGVRDGQATKRVIDRVMS
ncbi:MAG: CDP-glycerol glycerophosphotransferase family protein [Agathobacter sp.]|nr:CDP-glycerol glycerophosphotransferase family protein [Agathobacter sp.]